MPRQIHKLDKFEGGLSNDSDPRAIADNELALSEGINVSKPGKMVCMGDSATPSVVSGTPPIAMTELSPGYGIHFFKHDYPKLTSAEHSYEQEDTATKIEPNPNEYILYTQRADYTKISAYSYDDDAFETSGHSDYIGYTQAGFNAAHTPKHVFFTANGDTRTIDTNFDNITDSNAGDEGQKYRLSWLGYIKRNRWANTPFDTEGDNHPYNFSSNPGPCFQGWYNKDAHCYAPEAYNTSGGKPFIGEMAIREEDEHMANHFYTTAYPANHRFHLSIKYTKTVEGGWRGFKRYYITFIYDGVQESMPSAFEGLDEVWEDSIKEFRLYTSPKDTWRQLVDEDGSAAAEMYPLNQRITGGRVYFRDVDSDRQDHGDLYLLFEFDLEKGVKKALSEYWSGWVDCSGQGGDNASTNRGWVLRAPYRKDANGDLDQTAEEFGEGMLRFKTEPTGLTYEGLSGLQNDETSIYAAYKAFTIVNNRLYAGNIARFDTKKKGGTSDTFDADVHRSKDDVIVNGDAMVKSVVNCYDVLPTANKIEVSIGDGDDITCLENYADRILQFKNTKMHVINVSQDFEFLEGTFEDKGVWGPGAVCRTDFGVAWVNELGCYMYDGKQVLNLLEKKGVRLIKASDWATFVGSNPGIAFLPKERKLLVLDSYDSGDAGMIYMFDLVHQSWSYSSDRLNQSYNISNFVLDKDRDIYFVTHRSDASVDLKHFVWNDSPAAAHCRFITKDIDFGLPAVRKKVYKVYVTYKDSVSDGSGGSGVQVKYLVNGATNSGTKYLFNRHGTDISDSTPLLDANNANEWTTAELKPVTASEANNIYSFALWVYTSSEISSSFEIKDISIVYRIKNVK
jgi:hypothetical protein